MLISKIISKAQGDMGEGQMTNMATLFGHVGDFFFLVREILGVTLLTWDISRKELQSK